MCFISPFPLDGGRLESALSLPKGWGMNRGYTLTSILSLEGEEGPFGLAVFLAKHLGRDRDGL